MVLTPASSLNLSVPLGLPSPSRVMSDGSSKLFRYLHHLAGNYEEDTNVITKDHCYSRPWNWRPEHVYVRPLKKIFFPKIPKETPTNQDEIIDVVGVDEEKTFPQDLSKAQQVMNEFQRVANFVRAEDNEDWEDKFQKLLWSPIQTKVFTKVVKIINSERIARLSVVNNSDEPISRRASIDLAAKKFREALALTNWHEKITHWLHGLLFDHLPPEYLSIYLDILQAARQKIPQLIDKMIAVQPNINSKGSSVTWETLGPLLKKSWDPVTSVLNTVKPKKLPGNPILIIVPNGVSNNISPRQHKWIAQLGMLGMVIAVNPHLGSSSNRMTMITALEQLVQASRAKIQDVRVDFPGRPVILVGFHSGAALACQVGQMEHVTAIICLGFPMNTVDGKRGSPDDTLLDIRCPVMFIIGQNSMLARVDDVEDLRERMMVPTSLVVVGSADDHLRIPSSKKLAEKISQSMVDRCILDEIGDFMGGILLQPHPLPLRAINSVNNHDVRAIKRAETARKRRTSPCNKKDNETQSGIKKTRSHSPMNNNISGIQTNVIPKGTMVALTGTASTQTPKRKPRSYVNRNYSEQLMTSRLTNQQKIDGTSGGITLNIGSFASLAPVGPIRFEPASISLQGSSANKGNGNTVDKLNPYVNITKNNQISIGGQQNVAKIKMIMPTKKLTPQRGPNNFKTINPSESSNDTNVMNILTSGTVPLRTNVPTATVSNVKSGIASIATLPSINIAKSQTSTSGTIIGKPVTSSSILFTPKSSLAATTLTSTSTSTSAPIKVADITAPVRKSTSGFRGFPQHEQSPSIDRTNSLTTVKRIQKGLPRTKMAIKSPQKPSSRMPCFKDKNAKTNMIPMETTSTYTQAKPQVSTSLDDGLENILDIPIIIANDVENLNSFETLPQLSENKTFPIISSTSNKVVFINNKITDLQPSDLQIQGASEVARSSIVLNRGSSVQPSVRFTRIILTKKNESEDKTIPVILTKTRRTANFPIVDAKGDVKTIQGNLQNDGSGKDLGN